MDDTQRPGSQPRANDSSLGASVSLHAQGASHAFLALDIQGLVASVLSTLLLFRRQSMVPGRGLRLVGSLKGGGKGWIRTPPHIPLPPMLPSRVSP